MQDGDLAEPDPRGETLGEARTAHALPRRVHTRRRPTYSCRRPRLSPGSICMHLCCAAQRRTCPKSVSPPATSEHASIKARHRSDLRAVAARAGASGQMQTTQAPRSRGCPSHYLAPPTTHPLLRPGRMPRTARGPTTLALTQRILEPWRPDRYLHVRTTQHLLASQRGSNAPMALSNPPNRQAARRRTAAARWRSRVALQCIPANIILGT